MGDVNCLMVSICPIAVVVEDKNFVSFIMAMVLKRIVGGAIVHIAGEGRKEGCARHNHCQIIILCLVVVGVMACWLIPCLLINLWVGDITGGRRPTYISISVSSNA